ncbi:GntR family transcriptional regulator [Nitratireductor luteus]|uniref:GntR family transcriptional regulator n=1 Tax=Nitratireductor luteus TaxID=2976980 RepID=UPI00224015BE|nr:GntR family transcriptional regulator [Nitratireductor luteus]
MNALADIRKETLSSRIAADLRSSILRGDIAPDEKINLDRVREQFSTSVTPLREAMSRLVADGLVVFEDQRGYRVTPVSLRDLDEVVRLRTDLETLALGYAIQSGDLDWEGRVAGALYKLTRGERNGDAENDVETWERAHADFHLTLIDGCGMPHLIGFCRMLHNLNDRYRRIFLERPAGDPDPDGEHRRIGEAAMARRADEATELLKAHIARTGARLRTALQARSQKEPAK